MHGKYTININLKAEISSWILFLTVFLMHRLIGRGFNALDVIGLASVGLSTKGANTDEPKRTIGFMGVGFKAVYKRWIVILLI